MSFVLIPNLRISSAGVAGAAQPAEDPTVWFKADDIDGAGNATLSPFQELTGAVNYATSGSTPEHSAVGTNFTVVTSVGPTYQDTRLIGTASYVQQGFTQWAGSTDEAFELPDIALSGVILDDTWEVYAVGKSTNWPSPGNEWDSARIFGGEEPSTYWGLLASSTSSVDKWSGYAWDTNATYVRGTGSNDTDQIIRYRGERVTGSVYQYLKVDADAESEVLMGNTGIDEGTPSDGMSNTPRIGGSNSTNEYEGNIYEILVYNRVLTEQERSDTYDYLYEKWINVTPLPFPTPDFDPPDNSTISNFEFSGWPGTVANPITSSDFATYNNSATASFELGPWEFSFDATADLSTQYEYEQSWPGTLDPAYISGALATQFTASLHSASANYEFDGWPGTTDPPT